MPEIFTGCSLVPILVPKISDRIHRIDGIREEVFVNHPVDPVNPVKKTVNGLHLGIDLSIRIVQKHVDFYVLVKAGGLSGHNDKTVGACC